MAIKRRGIPASNANPELKLNALQEAVEVGQGVSGHPLERYITVGDLVDAGIIRLLNNYRGGRIGSGNIGPVVGTPVLETPPQPTGLTAVGLFTAIMLTWDEPQLAYANHSHTKIYRATSDNVANAVAIGISPGSMYADPVDPGITYYYWISFVSVDNVEGPLTTASVSAAASFTAEDLLESISDAINEGMLAPALRERLDLIDFPDTGLVDRLNQEIADRAQAILDAANALAADIAQEALDRQGAIDTEAEARQTLAAQMRGSYAGNNINEVTTGLLYQERVARVDGQSALALQISLLSAGVGGSFDPFVTWYFETNAEGWAGTGATVTWAQGAITVTSTGTDPRVSLSSLTINGAAYDVVKLRAKRLAGTGWQGDVYYSTGGHGFSDSYKKTLADPGATIDDYITLEFDMAALTAGGTDWKDSVITGLRIDLGNTADDVFVIDWIGVGRNAPAASVAQLLAEQQARATADSAEVAAREAIAVKVFGNTDPAAVPNLAAVSSGLIAQERDARVTAVASEVTARETLQAAMIGAADPATATLGSLTAGLVYAERQARVSAVGAVASDVSNINATLNHADNGLAATRTRVATVESRLNADGGYESLVTEFEAAKAVIEDAETGNAALAMQVDTLSGTVSTLDGDVTAALSEVSAVGTRLTRGQPNLFANPDCELAITSHLVHGTLSTASKHGGRRSIAFTNNTQGAAVWKQDETKGWPRFDAGQQFTLGYWARNATPFAAQFGYGTPASPFGHLTLPASTDWAFYQTTFVVPAGAMLADVSTTAAVRINATAFTGSDSGEFYVHGFTAGVAADVNGTIIDVNGSTLTLQRAAGLTNLAGITGYICYDKATSARFLVGGSYRRFAFVFINAGGVWVYDNNGAEVAFTPDANMVLIGNMVTGTADTITAAVIWPQALAFNGTALPQPTQAPAYKLLTSGTTMTAGVYFDDLVLMAGAHTLDGATTYATDGTPYALAERIRSTESNLTETDGVLAGQVQAMDALQLLVGNDFAGIQTLQTVTLGPNGLSAQYMLKTEVNGLVAGWGLYNDGAISDFGINVDRFFVGAPTYPARTPSTEYAVGVIRSNGGNLYKVTEVTGDSRSSAGGGPTGTGDALIDGNVTWAYLRPASAAPERFALVVDTANNRVLMDGASIVDATIDDAKILTLGVEKVVGLDATFMLATIGIGAITNAYIGQTIQSYSYNPATGVGWRIDKNGTIIASGLTILEAGTGRTLLASGSSVQPWMRQSSTMRVRKDYSAFGTTQAGDCYIHGVTADGLDADVDGYMPYRGAIITIVRGRLLTQCAGLTGYIAYYRGTDINNSPFTQSDGTKRRHALMTPNQLFGWLYDNNTTALQAVASLSNVVVIGMIRTHATTAGGSLADVVMLPSAQDPILNTLPKIAAFSMLDQINADNVSTYIANAAIDTLRLAGQAVTFPVFAKRISSGYESLQFSGNYPMPPPTHVVAVGGVILETAPLQNIDAQSMPVKLDMSLAHSLDLNFIVLHAFGGSLDSLYYTLRVYRVVGGVESHIDSLSVPTQASSFNAAWYSGSPLVYQFIDYMPANVTAIYRVRLHSVPRDTIPAERELTDPHRRLWLYRGVLTAVAHKR